MTATLWTRRRAASLPLIALFTGGASAASAPSPAKGYAMTNTHATRKSPFGDISPALGDYTDNVLFGDVWKRPGLSPRDRSLVTVACRRLFQQHRSTAAFKATSASRPAYPRSPPTFSTASVNGCLQGYVGVTAGVPQIAADSRHRPSRQSGPIPEMAPLPATPALMYVYARAASGTCRCHAN
jgi:hypothetical protein